MNTKSIIYLLTFLGSFLLITSCVRNEFDEPPADGEDPDLIANTTIAELKSLHSLGVITPIESDMIIQGVVVGDDESGNLFRTIVLEDATAGIHVSLNATGLYNEFTVGRKVWIKCRGLVLGDFNGLIQIGGSSSVDDNGNLNVEGIEEVLINEFVFPGLRNQPVTPTVYTIQELNTTLNSTLIQINDVEYVDGGITYDQGETSGSFGRNMTLRDCNGSSILVRTSTFATFIQDPTPSGNGTFIGIMGSFGTDRQLLVRNNFELDMTGVRCDGSTGGGGGGGGTGQGCAGTGDGVLDEDFEMQFDGEDIGLVGWCNLVIEGERVWFAREFGGNTYASIGAFNDPAPNAEAWMITETVDVTTTNILNFESAQNNWTHDGLTVLISSDFEEDPFAATWTELTDLRLAEENDSWFDFIPSGDVDLSDFSGNINIAFRYIGSSASGLTGSFHIDNVLISEDGVGSGGGGGGQPGECNGVLNGGCAASGDGTVDDNFDGQSPDDDIVIPGWCNIATDGNRLWIGKEFDGNNYAQASAFNDGDPFMSAWLITESVDVTEPKKLNFESAKAFYTHNALSVWISTDYSDDPCAATWEPLNGTLAVSADADHAFIPSGDIDLSAYTGNVNIAFRYDGGSSSGDTGTYRIDNVEISDL